MTILVTGGAGYIGSHTIKEILKKGHVVVTIDNLEKGHKEALVGGTFVKGDLRHLEDVQQVFAQYKIDAVIHFAAYASVPESVVKPIDYFENNLIGGLNLLHAMKEAGVTKIVFSSSAAVYGEPKEVPILEDAPKEPTNPYGVTKLQFEQILAAYDKAYGIKSVALRYFCAAGADPEGQIGENHDPETHVIPLALLTALGKRESFKIFGTDYPTHDGSGVRDFIHVVDLANIHIAALDYLNGGGVTAVYNCGNAKGYSVREVADMAKKISGVDFPVKEEPRRAGDPAVLVADSSKLQKELKIKLQFSDLETMMRTSWEWHKKTARS